MNPTTSATTTIPVAIPTSTTATTVPSYGSTSNNMTTIPLTTPSVTAFSLTVPYGIAQQNLDNAVNSIFTAVEQQTPITSSTVLNAKLGLIASIAVASASSIPNSAPSSSTSLTQPTTNTTVVTQYLVEATINQILKDMQAKGYSTDGINLSQIAVSIGQQLTSSASVIIPAGLPGGLSIQQLQSDIAQIQTIAQQIGLAVQQVKQMKTFSAVIADLPSLASEAYNIVTATLKFIEVMQVQFSGFQQESAQQKAALVVTISNQVVNVLGQNASITATELATIHIVIPELVNFAMGNTAIQQDIGKIETAVTSTGAKIKAKFHGKCLIL